MITSRIDMSLLRKLLMKKYTIKMKGISALTAAAPRPMVLGFLLDARTSEVGPLLPALGVVLALVKESSEAPARSTNVKIKSADSKHGS